MKRNTTFYITGIVFLFLLVHLINGCKPDEPLPANPYDDVDYPEPDTYKDTLDPNSFTWIHREILVAKCAMPGCHDGAFEPDFRTVQSAYASLVYHGVVKHLDPWELRVVPFDTANSWLWQRINYELIVSGSDTSQGRMPLYAPQLSPNELTKISNWIMNGAKDMFGVVATYPNTEPQFTFYIALDTLPLVTKFYSDDTNRINNSIIFPFIVDPNSRFYFYPLVEDDSTALQDLQVNTLKCSFYEDDFSNAIEYQGQYFDFPGVGNGWIVDVNTSDFPTDTTVYMRYYVNDGNHAIDTEFPYNDLLIQEYKSHWSFYINP